MRLQRRQYRGPVIAVGLAVLAAALPAAAATKADFGQVSAKPTVSIAAGTKWRHQRTPVPVSPSPTPTTPSPTPTTASPTPTSASPTPTTPSPSPSTTSPAPASGTTGRPLLIKHGWDMPSPSFVRANIAAMDTEPYDGLAISIPTYAEKIDSQTPVSYSQLWSVLSPLAGLPATRLLHNYVTAYAAPAGSPFADWSVPISNFSNLAKAARAAGVEGVLFDNEQYFGSVYDYPGDCPGYTLAQCQAQMRLRGQQVMDAMRAAWPDITVMTTYGAWVSDPATATNLSPYFYYGDVSYANELMGSFAVGIAQSAAGSAASVVDGGEVYTERTTAQFNKMVDWETQGMSKSPLVPAALQPSWAGTVKPAVAIYDQPYQGLTMDCPTFGTTIKNALASNAAVVWVYTERYDWWGSGWPSTPVPSTWVSTVRSAWS